MFTLFRRNKAARTLPEGNIDITPLGIKSTINKRPATMEERLAQSDRDCREVAQYHKASANFSRMRGY